MDIAAREIGQVTVLDLSGKLTRGAGVAALQSSLERLLAEGGRQFLLNLEGVPYMDSSGIGELMMSYQRVTAAGGTIKLLNPLKRVYDVLHLIKIDTVFETHKDEAEAVKSFRTRP